MTTRYQLHIFLFRAEKKGDNRGCMLINTIGNNMIDTQRRSYRRPIKKHGKISPNENEAGTRLLNTKKATSRKIVKITKKITIRLATHNKVFGILKRASMVKRTAKELKLS
jgi:hypothetical protein